MDEASSSARATRLAFGTVLAERAMSEADRAPERLQAGEQTALLGLPVAVKDPALVFDCVACHTSSELLAEARHQRD